MKFKIKCSLFLVAALTLLGGCAVGPNYHRPAVHTPEGFRFADSQATNSFGDLPWWQVFQDPILKGYIGTALTNNYDLKQAVARVEQARFQAAVANSAFFPRPTSPPYPICGNSGARATVTCCRACSTRATACLRS
jgi:multidrug efflux system outer membrane protein